METRLERIQEGEVEGRMRGEGWGEEEGGVGGRGRVEERRE